jgi:chemotaxis protein CheX
MIRFDDDEVFRIVQNIWEVMLEVPLRPQSEFGKTRVPETRANMFSACVQITGAWTGAVRIDCADRLARRTAGALFQLPPEEVAREEILDALCEVTNMTAGSIKPLLPRLCHISLPFVVDGADYELSVRKGQVLLSSHFDSDSGGLEITLIEAVPR